MAVRAEQRGATFPEPFQMHLMANAVSRSGKDRADLRGDGLQVRVVVCVFIPDLHGIVIDVTDRKIVLHMIDAQRLEFQVHHRSCGVLRQCLVNTNANVLPRLVRALHKVGAKNFFRQCLCHGTLHRRLYVKPSSLPSLAWGNRSG
jgi:hypothetical protein